MGPTILAVVGCLYVAGCTDLRVVNRDFNTTLPWYDERPRWHSNDHSAETVLENGFLYLRSSIPHQATQCAELHPEAAICDDLDADGLVDAWEDMASHRLIPVIRFHVDEPLFTDKTGRVHAFSRVTPVSDNIDRIRVFIALTYSYDYGRCSLRRHRGDLERVVLELLTVQTEPTSVVRVNTAYTAAHEHTSFDQSALYPSELRSSLEYGEDPVIRQPRWIIYASAGKHASYASRIHCTGNSTLPCARENCPSASSYYELLFPVVHVGEPQESAFSWSRQGGEEWWASFDAIWDGGSFCGGDTTISDRTSCTPSSIRRKLTHDPFNEIP